MGLRSMKNSYGMLWTDDAMRDELLNLAGVLVSVTPIQVDANRGGSTVLGEHQVRCHLLRQQRKTASHFSRCAFRKHGLDLIANRTAFGIGRVCSEAVQRP